jgi:microcystin-dependent protein
MSYVGEIRMFAGAFAPRGWAFCDGNELTIAAFSPLFDVIGTTYGGDGTSTFKLPDLRGRVPISQGTRSSGGSTFPLGQAGGSEEVTLTTDHIPAHSHMLLASGAGANGRSPVGNALATAAATIYTNNPGRGLASMATSAIGNYGGSQSHTNLQPYICISFIISLHGGGEDQYVGEIRMFSFGFAPPGWALCDGRQISLQQSVVLFGLLTGYYGNGPYGNGPGLNVNLPNLLGSAVMFWGHGPELSNRRIGDRGGVSAVNLQEGQMPSHTHQLGASTQTGDSNLPAGSFVGTGTSVYAQPNNLQPMAQTLAHAGNSGGHNNMMPYLTVYFCIALQGLDPPH